MATIVIDSLNGNFTGTSGDDVFVFTAPSGFTNFTGSIDGAGGNDTLQLIGSAQSLSTPAGPLTQFNFSAGTLSSVESVDYLSGAGDKLLALFGYGQLPDGTTLIGGEGRDGIIIVAQGVTSPITVPAFSFQNWGESDNGGTGQDYVVLASNGSSGIDISARENVPGVQVLENLVGPAVLHGSNGSDTFAITSGGTTAQGGGGDDIFSLTGGNNSARIFSGLQLDGGDGFDKLVLTGDSQISSSSIVNIEALSFQQNPSTGMLWPHLTIDTASTGTQPVIEIEGSGSITLNLSGHSFSGAGVTFAPDAVGYADIHGTALADTITGTSADDAIYGNDGNDYLRGASGDDQLFGGNGNDRLEGGQGSDILYGGAGNDILLGGLGTDTANYSDLVAATGSIGVHVNLALGSAQDTGLGGIDTLAGIENLTGSNYNDVLIGNAGKNVLDGGSGADILTGGSGADILVGGSGPDIFVYQAVSDSVPGVSTRDQIIDFSHSDGDRIDLSAIDANVNVAGDQAFFLGGSAFTHHAGQVIQVASSAGMTLKADVNGDGVADFALLLSGVSKPLQTADFIF